MPLNEKLTKIANDSRAHSMHAIESTPVDLYSAIRVLSTCIKESESQSGLTEIVIHVK